MFLERESWKSRGNLSNFVPLALKDVVVVVVVGFGFVCLILQIWEDETLRGHAAQISINHVQLVFNGLNMWLEVKRRWFRDKDKKNSNFPFLW